MADWMDEIERLAELRDKGLITDEEFEVKRQEIINVSSKEETPAEKPPEIEETVEESSEPAVSRSISELKPSSSVAKESGYGIKINPKTGVATPKNKTKSKGPLIVLLLIAVAVIIGIAVSQGGDSSTSTSSAKSNDSSSEAVVIPTTDRIPSSDSCLPSTDKRFQEVVITTARVNSEIFEIYYRAESDPSYANSGFSKDYEEIMTEYIAVFRIWKYPENKSSSAELSYCDAYLDSIVVNALRDQVEYINEYNNFLVVTNQAYEMAQSGSSEEEVAEYLSGSGSVLNEQLVKLSDSMCIVSVELKLQIGDYFKGYSDLC